MLIFNSTICNYVGHNAIMADQRGGCLKPEILFDSLLTEVVFIDYLHRYCWACDASCVSRVVSMAGSFLVLPMESFQESRALDH